MSSYCILTNENTATVFDLDSFMLQTALARGGEVFADVVSLGNRTTSIHKAARFPSKNHGTKRVRRGMSTRNIQSCPRRERARICQNNSFQYQQSCLVDYHHHHHQDIQRCLKGPSYPGDRAILKTTLPSDCNQTSSDQTSSDQTSSDQTSSDQIPRNSTISSKHISRLRACNTLDAAAITPEPSIPYYRDRAAQATWRPCR